MTGWLIVAAVLAALLLISLIRLGGQVKYSTEGFSATVLIGTVRIRLLPRKPGKRRKRSPKKVDGEKKRAPKATEHAKARGTLGHVMEVLPVIAEAAGALRRKIRIDRLDLTVIWAAEDPASAALGYGRANAILGMIWPLLDHNFKVKKCDWQVEVDYEKTTPELSVDAAITATIGQLAFFAICYGTKILNKLRRSVKSSANQQEG